MDETEVLAVAREAIIVLIKMGAPAMLIALAVGLTIAVFQVTSHHLGDLPGSRGHRPGGPRTCRLRRR